MYSYDSRVASQIYVEKLGKKIYCVGDTSLLGKKIITVVGPRKPTEYAIYVTRKIISELQHSPVVICSGLATGIDSIAHKTAIEHTIPTIAFPGSSLEEEFMYPKAHLSLAREIVQKHGLLCSLWQKQAGAPWTFPKRNTLLAKIADYVLVVQAGVSSGSLLTAQAAIEQRTPLGVIPGPIDSELSKGSNLLLQDGAQCVLCTKDITDTLLLEHPKKQGLSHPLLKYISQPITHDALAKASHQSLQEITQIITQLELNGVVTVDMFGLIRIR